jgi:hypothetical protein
MKMIEDVVLLRSLMTACACEKALMALMDDQPSAEAQGG